MTHEFIPYEQALALKELGFDEPCFALFNRSDKPVISGNTPVFNSKTEDGLIICTPLYQQVFRWFRQKHNLQAEMVFSEKPDRFYYYIGNMVTGDMDRGSNMSYEEAELACLNKLIEIVKNK